MRQEKTTVYGISQTDHARLHDLVLAVVNSTAPDTQKEKNLLGFLDRLLNKYGELPTLLETKADFAESPKKSLSLYKRAFRAAKARDDRMCLTSIAASVARLYVEDLDDPLNGRRWLDALDECLKSYQDKESVREYKRLERKLRNLIR